MPVRRRPSTARFFNGSRNVNPAKPADGPTQGRRPVRSFVIRSGRLTDAQRKAIASHWDTHVIPTAEQHLPLSELFPHAGKLVVEIGFGMGDSLLEMASQAPETNFIGIEVHRPGVGKLLHGIAERELTNLKIICRDATEVLAQCLPPESIDRILIFFPDPWPKKKHHKRRLVQPEFMALLRERLKPGGQIHLATDWQEYAEYMLEVMEAVPGLRNSQGQGQYWAEPQRPGTKFERRGKRLGHGVWDLLYVKD